MAAPLDLSQLELVLNPSFGGGVGTAGGFAMNLDTQVQSASQMDDLFAMSDLDQKPRVIYQPGPVMTARVRKNSPGSVQVIFVVDVDGRVTDLAAKKSTHPELERAALAAVKKWKFEPVKHKGKAVRFPMRVPITFPQP